MLGIDFVVLYKLITIKIIIIMEKPFSLKENSHHIDNIFMVKIDPSFISVLRQSRTIMSNNGIEELCSSIKEGGQRTPGDIYAFEKSEAIFYLEKMNEL